MIKQDFVKAKHNINNKFKCGGITLEQLAGVVENIIFENSDNGFVVFKLKADQKTTAITVLANATAPLVGEQLELSGDWITHVKFGQQFKARTVKRVAPTSLQGIERFLASGVIKGIGKAMAKRIVDAFGQESLKVLEHYPKKLEQIPGIGRKKAQDIHQAYSKQSELREIMLFLELNGVSSAYAGKIYAKYSSFAIEVLKDDPYKLARDIDGIGFKTADQIATSLGFNKNDNSRIVAGVDYALTQVAQAGHCCVPEFALIEQTAKLLLITRMEVAEQVKKLLQQDRLCIEYVGGETLIYPRYLYYAEKEVAEKLLYLKNKAKTIGSGDYSRLVLEWEEREGIQLADNQRKAIISALEHGVLVLTGGPGTGKTTVIKGILAVLESQGLQIILGAPTGRAAKRLSEATARQASTVHRLLEATGGGGEGISMFAKNENEPLEGDVIIIDEVSMMDINLMSSLLQALAKGCRLILVGDVDQLPSVGPGSVLKDILISDTVPKVVLTEVFRQSGESSIVLNAHLINRGQLPQCNDTDFKFIELTDSALVAQNIVKLCLAEVNFANNLSLNDVQVLSPMHRLDCGVENLNKLLQTALNPETVDQEYINGINQVFRRGDKVMQIRNNYIKNVFNGDIGFIKKIENNTMVVAYPDIEVSYEQNELTEIQLAYAMSVHKSQGSEYKVVIMPLIAGHHVMLQRNLLYTAVTRAKDKVILLGSKAALNTAVSNDKTKKRYSLLAERLKGDLLN